MPTIMIRIWERKKLDIGVKNGVTSLNDVITSKFYFIWKAFWVSQTNMGWTLLIHFPEIHVVIMYN
jgi:hypothetical protein